MVCMKIIQSIFHKLYTITVLYCFHKIKLPIQGWILCKLPIPLKCLYRERESESEKGQTGTAMETERESKRVCACVSLYQSTHSIYSHPAQKSCLSNNNSG